MSLEIDTTTPASMAHFVDMRDRVQLQHGGLVSRMHFKSVQAMDIETFISVEVPKLKDNHTDLYYLRDTVNDNISLIYQDQVIKYNLEGIDEVGVKELASLLQVHEPKRFYPDIPYPLIGYVETGANKIITVYMASRKFKYKGTRILGYSVFEDDIWCPPIWFRVTLTKANVVTGVAIVSVQQNEIHAKDTKLYTFVLPNIHPNGEVCLGTTSLSGMTMDDSTRTDGMCIMASYNQIFNSQWNLDLLYYKDQQKIGLDAYNSLPKIKKYEEAIEKNKANADACGLLRILRVLREPMGYATLNNQVFGQTEGNPKGITAQQFIDGEVSSI